MKEVELKIKIAQLMDATTQKDHDLIKESITPDSDGVLTEMYLSKLLDGNGYQTLRTISRNDNGADVICYSNYSNITNIYQIKNKGTKVGLGIIRNDFIKIFDNEEYINKPYAYVAINGYSKGVGSEGYYTITKQQLLQLIEESKLSKELKRRFPKRSQLRSELENIISIKDIKDMVKLKEVIEQVPETSYIRQILKEILVIILGNLNELEPKLLDEYSIKLHDFDFIKELIDNYDPMVEQGSISEEEFNSIYKKAIEKYIYNDSEINFDEEHELLIKAYDERSIKIEYVKALEDIQRCIDNKMNIKPKKTGPSYEETWLKSFNRILTPGQPIKDSFNCNDDSGWIRRQIKSLVEGTLIENRREFLYSVSFIETFISLYYKVKR